MIRNSPRAGARFFRPFIPIPACTALVCALAIRASSAELKAEQISPVARWTNAIPTAFVKSGRIRLYFTNEGFTFDAKWKESRVAAQEFSYASTTVKCDESPPALPSQSSSWKRVRTVSTAESEQLVRSAASRLTPTNANYGIYAQISAGDVVLFRDVSGDVKWARFEEKPANVVIEKRYGRQEIASALVQAVEADLRAAYPNETRFVAMLGRGMPRLLYLDLDKRESVVLFVPRAGRDPDRPKLGGNIKTLMSFAVVDNGWSFLKNPISSATRTVHQAWNWSVTFLQPTLRPRIVRSPAVTNVSGMDLVAWEKWLDGHIGVPRERGAIRLLINGENFFPHFERRLAEATSNINIHVCIFDRDDVAVGIADTLKARSTNVEVKVIFDRLNSRSAGEGAPATPMPASFVAPRSITSYLRDSQVQVHPQLNPAFTCDHSKVFLIDGRYAYIGGMNFGREYRYEWHDLMAEVEGPVVASMQRQFDKKWAQTGLWGDCALAVAAMRGKSANSSPEPPDSIELRRIYTKTFDRQIRSAQLAAIDRAQNHIFLENAYLYSNDMIVALVRARQRGVDVRVIMPGENDFGSGHSSNLVTAGYLLQHGVRVYFFPGMSHVKALLVDGWVCFGSANSDALSLRLNREGNLATSDPAFAARFRREVFEADMSRARELNKAVAVGFGDHLSDMLLNPF